MSGLDPITWAMLLMLVGCTLAVVEVFVPSGGILGFLATFSVVAAIAMAFYNRGPRMGLGFALVAVVVIPTGMALALKYWPHTPMGRRFLLGLPTDEELLPNDKRLRLKGLVGKIGVVKSPMLPSGAVQIEGRTYDAVSEGLALDPGQAVQVVEVRAYRILVRPIDAQQSRHLTQAGPEELLQTPLDELGIEPLDDPLA